MNVKILYLVTGHTVIADVEICEDGMVNLTRPIRVEIQVTEQGPVLLPLPFGGALASQMNTDTVPIEPSHIVVMEVVDVQMEKFWQDVTSPIKTATPAQTSQIIRP